MSNAVRIWQISKEGRLRELERSRLDFESRLEDWIEQDITILSADLMIIGRQVNTDYGTVIDLLCIDSQGDLAVLELKRDQTPRDTVAQALDYASWIRGLSRGAICSIADSYLRKVGKDTDLEAEFANRFNAPLPDTLNVGHRMVIVAASMDEPTERIVRYLSEAHNVGINVAEFKYYQDSAGNEYLSRVFLVEPDTQQGGSGGTEKRKRRLSLEELEAAADQNGVGEIYRHLDDGCSTVFNGYTTTKTSLAFIGKGFMEWGQWNVIFSLIPTDSNPEDGLKFQIYLSRIARFLKTSESEIITLLPEDRHEWSFGETVDKDWTGVEGHFSSIKEAETFVAGITELKKRSADDRGSR